MKNKSTLYIWGLLIFTISLTMPLCADALIGQGRFTLLPELSLYETYRSNIFLTQSDRKSDFVTTVTPGIGLKYLFGRNSLALGYKVGFLNFAKYSTNNYQDHRANGLLNLVAPAGLELTLADNYTRSTLERAGVITRQRPFHYNTFNGTVGRGFADRWRVEARLVREDQSFDSFRDRYAEYTNSLYGAGLYYRLLSHTSGLIEYDYVIKDFVTSTLSNHHDQLVYGGVAFDPGGKLRGTFKAGYGWKNFDTELVGRDNSPRNWIMAAQIVDDFDARTKLTLDALRTLSDDIDTGNASFVNTMASVTMQRFFTEKTGAAGSVLYRRGDYLDRLVEPVTGALKLRTDKVWVFGATAFYNVQKWLQLRLEYQFQDKASNFDQYSYIEHRVIFRVVFAP